MLRTIELNERFQSTHLAQTFQEGFFFLYDGIFCNAITSSLLAQEIYLTDITTKNLYEKKEKKRNTL